MLLAISPVKYPLMAKTHIGRDMYVTDFLLGELPRDTQINMIHPFITAMEM